MEGLIRATVTWGQKSRFSGLVEALRDERVGELRLERYGALALGADREQAGPVRRNRRGLGIEADLDRSRVHPLDDLGDPLDVALRVVGEEAEGHVQRLGGDRPQRGVGERLALPCHQPLAHPLRQVERHEQPRPRALQPLLGHLSPTYALLRRPRPVVRK